MFGFERKYEFLNRHVDNAGFNARDGMGSSSLMMLLLASYPRSGNTFLRVLLNQVFGLPSIDIHGSGAEQAFIRNGVMFEAMGGVTHDLDPMDFIAQARLSDRLELVKTHERPIGADPAIYLVRDGRSSIMSYYHYIRNVENLDCSLEDVIRGAVYGGSWSEHIYDWAPERRERTLLIRFENLVNDPESELGRVGQFLCLEPHIEEVVTFEWLNAAFPTFFRSGSDTNNIRELQDSGYEELFWRWHTPMMTRMGYTQ